MINYIKKLFSGNKSGLTDGYDFCLVKDDFMKTTHHNPDGSTIEEVGGYRLIPQTYSAYSWCDHTIDNLSPNVMAEGVFLTRKQRVGLLKLLAQEELSVYEVEP
jgi:hypothetical protein